MEKMFDLVNGHTIKIEDGNRGIKDDFKITFYEDGRKLFDEYGNRDYIAWQYDVEF